MFFIGFEKTSAVHFKMNSSQVPARVTGNPMIAPQGLRAVTGAPAIRPFGRSISNFGNKPRKSLAPLSGARRGY